MVGSQSEKMTEIYFSLELEYKLMKNLLKEADVLSKYSFEIQKILLHFPKSLKEELDGIKNDEYFPVELLNEHLKKICYSYLKDKNLEIRGNVNEYFFHKYSIAELTNEALKINKVTKVYNIEEQSDKFIRKILNIF